MYHKYTTKDIGEFDSRDIFFDANILIYLFWATGKEQRHLENKYATIYSEILKKGLSKYVNFVVLSEVVNRTLRISWEEYLDIKSLSKSELSFKKFRNSKKGIKAQKEIATIINEIIFGDFEVIEDFFSKSDIADFLNIETLDFSDKAILKTCSQHDYILLTHDSDYFDSEIDILTCNSRIQY